jgi:hypothetical protein
MPAGINSAQLSGDQDLNTVAVQDAIAVVEQAAAPSERFGFLSGFPQPSVGKRRLHLVLVWS